MKSRYFVLFSLNVLSTMLFICLPLCSSLAAETGIAEAEDAAVRMFDRIREYSRSHPGVPGAMIEWHDAMVGMPLLVVSCPARESLYYLVPVQSPDQQTLSLMAIDALTYQWEWYGGYRGERPFPSISRTEAVDHMQAYCAEHGIEEDPAVPVLTRLPDNGLYWWTTASTKTSIESEFFLPLRGDPQVLTKEKLNHLFERDLLNPPRKAGERQIIRAPDRIESDLPPAYNIEGVPFHQQETSWYCGEAALQMIFDYHGPLISQTDIGDAANEDPSYGTYSDDLRRASHFSSISQAVQNASLAGYRERDLGYGGLERWWSDPQLEPFRFEDLKTLVSQNYPVLILTWFDESYSDGHYRVVKGYNDSLNVFIVHDPWYDHPGGADCFFSQDYLVDDLWPYSGRWGCLVAPWHIGFEIPTRVPTNMVFALSCSVRYPGPYPFEDAGLVYAAQASLILPGGFSIETGTPTQMCPSIDVSGSEGTVQWTVRSPSSPSAFDTIRVAAKGFVNGSSWSYPSYSDWIGGAAHSVISTGENFFYYVGYAIDDDVLNASYGNSDRVADAGETIEIPVTVGYLGDQSSESITAYLSLARPNNLVSLIDTVARFDDIQGDTVITCRDAFMVGISAGLAADTTALFALELVDSHSRTLHASFEVPLNAIAEVLLVSDDGGQDGASRYISSLHSGGTDFDRWDVSSSGQVSKMTLQRHSSIIWFTGQAEESTLTRADQDLLSDYLEGGSRLFLSGQNVARDLSHSVEGTAFLSHYLHAGFVDNVAGIGFLQGVAGDPIAGPYRLMTFDGTQSSPDVITVLDEALPVFTYYTTERTAALRYENGYRLVFFAFGFEGLMAMGGSSETLRSTILENVLSWLSREAVRGDVNEDGRIDVLDVLSIVNIILGVTDPSPYQEWAADFNQDHAVNVLDAVSLINLILGPAQ